MTFLPGITKELIGNHRVGWFWPEIGAVRQNFGISSRRGIDDGRRERSHAAGGADGFERMRLGVGRGARSLSSARTCERDNTADRSRSRWTKCLRCLPVGGDGARPTRWAGRGWRSV